MMVRFLSAVGREVRGMHEAAYLLAGFALLSQILALLRDRILAAEFGAGHTLDLYYAAFRIPDFLFATVASLTQLRHRFVLYSISPLLYNVGIIIGVVFFYPHIGVAGLAWGVVLGAALHMLQAPFFFAEERTTKMPFALMLKSFWEVLAL